MFSTSVFLSFSWRYETFRTHAADPQTTRSSDVCSMKTRDLRDPKFHFLVGLSSA